MKISELPSLSTGFTPTADFVPLVHGGTTWKVATSDLGVSSGGTAGSSIVPVQTVGASGASRTITFPATGSICYDVTLTASCAFTVTGGTVGELQTMTLYLRQNATAGWTATLPTRIKWSGGTPPSLNRTAGRIDILILTTPDGGTTLFGSY